MQRKGIRMTDSFNEYQLLTRETAIYPGALSGDTTALSYCSLGLAGEVGEVANKIKKIIRDKEPAQMSQIAYELGDAQWYLARLADELGVPLGAIVVSNLEKLSSRKERGTLSGSGDNR